jgi:hypothetical protein
MTRQALVSVLVVPVILFTAIALAFVAQSTFGRTPENPRYIVDFLQSMAAHGDYLFVTEACSQPPHSWKDEAAFCSDPQVVIVDQATWDPAAQGDKYP